MIDDVLEDFKHWVFPAMMGLFKFDKNIPTQTLCI